MFPEAKRQHWWGIDPSRTESWGQHAVINLDALPLPIVNQGFRFTARWLSESGRYEGEGHGFEDKVIWLEGFQIGASGAERDWTIYVRKIRGLSGNGSRYWQEEWHRGYLRGRLAWMKARWAEVREAYDRRR